MTEVPIKIRFSKSLNNLLPSRLIVVKPDNASDFQLYVTDKSGNPFPLKDEGGAINSIINSDGNIVITGTEDKIINISPALLSLINSALQSGDNISELTNDVGYLTSFTETDPIFQASEASLFVAGDKANLDNQSGINTGDETALSIRTKRPLKTINGESLEGSGNVQIDYNDLDNLPTIPISITNHSDLNLDDGTNPHGTTKNDVGLGNVPNLDTTYAVNNSHTHSNKSILDLITEPFTTSLKSLYDGAVASINNLLSTGQRLITSSEITKLSNTSGTNTGDETTLSIQTKRPLKTIEGQSLEGTGNIDLTKNDVGLNNVDNTSDIDKPISTATQNGLNSKLDKVTTSGVERVYTINTDGSQGTKPTSDFKDVIEGYFNGTNFYTDALFTNLITPETSKIYINLAVTPATQYRWSGSAYVQIGGDSEVEQQLQRYWYSMTANTLNTTLMLVNNTNVFTIAGTASIVSRASTLYYNSIAMNNYLSATANGSNCGIKNNNQSDGSCLEGFDSTFVFINNNTNVNCETTVGYYGLLSAIPNINKVNYTTDFVGVGNDVGDTNLSFYCRRSTLGVSFTKVDCGSEFPAHTTTDAYIFRMQMSRGYDGSGRTLKMTITNIITGAVFSHTFTDTQIPSHSRNIAMVVNRSNRNTGVATNIRFSKWHQTKYIY